MFILLSVVMATSACSGEDRTGERPLAPTDVTVVTLELGDSCILKGHVGESHNSSLTKCGFYWGNDSTSYSISCDPNFDFMDTITSTDAGNYYVVAYASNYIGTTLSDTSFFYISK